MTPNNWDDSNNSYPGGQYSGGDGGPPNSPNHQIQKVMALLNWSVPIGVYLSVRVRLHILLLGYAAYELFTTDSFFWSLRMLLVLFGSVLLHEFGHVLACRKIGGSANEILLWPLGGLAYCSPPHSPWAHFVTVVWGPIVNLILATAAYIALWVWQGQMNPVGLNPFMPWIGWPETTAVELVAQVFVVNYLLMLFNVLMVFYPLDGGRILQTILWAKLGYGKGSFITSRIGIGAALIVLVFGLIQENRLLTIIAFFGLFESIQLGMRLKAEAMMGHAYEAVGYGHYTHHSQPDSKAGMFRRWTDKRRKKARMTKDRRDQVMQQEVDRILDKVREKGLASLTRKEKKILNRETERQKRVG